MTTRLLNDDILQQVRDVFDQIQNPIEILFFGSKKDCQYCDDTLQLVTEVTGISDKLGLSIYDADEDAEIARQYKVDKFPGLVIVGRDGDQIQDYGIRYAGIPSGHEFSSLIHDLVLISGRDSGSFHESRNYLHSLDTPVHLQVFVTTT